MIESMKRMIVGILMFLEFPTATTATRDLITYQPKKASQANREVFVEGFLHHSTKKNDFFRELLDDGKHRWITTMSLSTGPPDTTTPSNFPHAKQLYPTISPSTKSVPGSSMSPPNSKQEEFTLKPSFLPQKTIRPAQAPFIYYKPVNKSSQSGIPTHHPSTFGFQEPSTTLSPQSDAQGENVRTDKPTTIPIIDKTSTQPSETSTNHPPTLPNLDAFECDFNNVITIAEPPVRAVTAVNFTIGYEIESTANPADYIEGVERLIMITALAGALQCETGGVFFTNLTAGATGRSKEKLRIPFNTTSRNETCEASISSCKIFETHFQVALNKVVDPEIAAFLGYVMLKENMDDGSFAQNIPNIDRCEYLKPLPLLSPMKQSNGTSKEENQSTERLSVSPWSLAAVSAMCAGGVLAIALWNKKRYRNRRHMELIEEASVGSPLDSWNLHVPTNCKHNLVKP